MNKEPNNRNKKEKKNLDLDVVRAPETQSMVAALFAYFNSCAIRQYRNAFLFQLLLILMHESSHKAQRNEPIYFFIFYFFCRSI